MDINAETLRKIRDDKDLTQPEFAKFLGISYSSLQSYEGGNKIPEAKKLLITQKLSGDLHLENKSKKEKNLKVVTPPIANNKKGVPYYDVDFYGGFDFAFNDQTIQPSFMIDYAPYNDCDAWINVSGKSMSPFISHGDIAALKKLNNWKEFIPFGEIYAVLTDEHKTIKIVTAGSTEETLTLIPYNKSREFVEQEIPKKLIRQMYRVKGSIKKFF